MQTILLEGMLKKMDFWVINYESWIMTNYLRDIEVVAETVFFYKNFLEKNCLEKHE